MGKLAKAAAQSMIAPAQNQSIQFVDDAGNAIVVTQQDVMQFICPQATGQEVVFFMELCRAQRLNPFLREAFLVKYKGSPASMITAEVVFERRANAHPDYEGMECGVTFLNKNGVIDKREGTATYRVAGETLVGGWARVHRKGRSDSYAEITLDEYDKGQSVWKTMPGVMINKCAKAVALRLAFPSDFQGMYLEEEMGSAPSVIEVHDAVVSDGESEQPQGPTDEEKAEMRSLTDGCVVAGHDGGVTARRIYDAYIEGGMDAARAEASAVMATDPATGEVELADDDIDF